jgi:hypothetical protein
MTLLDWRQHHLWIRRNRQCLPSQRVSEVISAEIVALPERRFPRAAAQTRIVSVARIRLDPPQILRPFKGIICGDISECLPQVRSPMGNLRAQGRAFTIHTASVSRLPAGGDVEGVEEHAGVMPAIADAVEARHALSSHATALPFTISRGEPSASTISRKRSVRSLAGRL